jgi:hypothetical protein
MRFRRFFRIKSNFDKLIKRRIRAKTKGYKLKEVIKILVGKNTVIYTLEFTI